MTKHSVPVGSIIVAVDGSEHAERALAWAVRQARTERRPLALVHCTTHAEPPGVLTVAASAASLLADDVDLSVHRIEGDPRDVIAALSTDAAMIVLGSRGRGAVRSALLGSVSASLASHAACPVIVCRPHVDEQQHRVVVGADGSPESRPVLEFAFEQASLHGWPLTVMHCFWDVLAATVGRGNVVARADDGLDDLRLLTAESVAGLAEKYPDVEVTRELARGLVDECLAGRGADASLLVVGRSSATVLDRFLYSSCALAVLERARTTVAVVPETPIERNSDEFTY
jgi:nucleotide-binding universal stress UspA family protein